MTHDPAIRQSGLRTPSLLFVGTLSLVLLAFAWAVSAADADASSSESQCTLVLGFSQTADWYMAPEGRSTDPDQPPRAAQIFESHVDGDRWQLQWTGGAGVNVYADPDDEAWDANVLFPCERSSDEPDRIVYMISGPHGTDETAWADDINVALDNIRDHFPSAHTIALQPVVGAPERRDECVRKDGATVRASWQADHIINAIETVAPQHDDVIAGSLTRVKACSHYSDALGHIDGGGARAAAAETGRFYSKLDW